MSEFILQLDKIEKRFGDAQVLCGISLDVSAGEFITLLGASGCGKTTTLRIIAGLEHPDSGRVLLQGRDVTDEAPNKRPVNTVFQNYALFPHMSVEANVGYSLKLKRTPAPELRRAVEEALELVQLSGFEKRMPHELSGGQKQRVAIARSVISKPKLLLLDEPLGALDLQLRRQMQAELKDLQRRLGITFIYITHDQEEALNMSDRIAVMREGRFEQIGTPSQVYDSPKTGFVARFVGEANIISGTVESTGDPMKISTAGGIVLANAQENRFQAGDPISVAVRSEKVNLVSAPDFTDHGVTARVKDKRFTGGVLHITVELQDGAVLVSSRHGMDSPLSPGDIVTAFWSPQDAVPVEPEGV